MTKIEVEEWHPTKTKDPDPDCEHCHGTGIWYDVNGNPTDLSCTCIIDFSSGKTVKKMVDITIEKTDDGGAIIHMED